jgi:hypothetical protein
VHSERTVSGRAGIGAAAPRRDFGGPDACPSAVRRVRADLFRLAKDEKTGQTRARFNFSNQLEAPMSHSQMLKTRRAKQRTRKQLAGIAKRAKKTGKQNVKTASADTQKTGTP